VIAKVFKIICMAVAVYSHVVGGKELEAIYYLVLGLYFHLQEKTA
jgi:hypothetical protein